MYSDMSIRTSASSSPNRNSASVRASSVLPTPEGPRKMNEPVGRLGSFRPARERLIALEMTSIAGCWPITRLCSSSSMRISFCVSASVSLNTGMPVHIETMSAIGEEEIADIVSMWTGIPVFKLTEAETQKLMRMEDELHKRVIGQHPAIEVVSKAIRRSRAGLKDPKRPTGSFIFLGPSGVGKTELARTLAEFLFGDEDTMIRIDMSEYMEKHAVSRLVGSPPGYIGYDEGGQLTEAVRRKPFSVLLLDEIEKAHPDVFNILLQILEDGRLTDAQGRTVDFRHCIVIMTSNIGASEIARNTPLGFAVSDDETGITYDDMKNRIMGELKKVFRPEFLNRIDDVIVFHKLAKDEIKQIVELLLLRIRESMAERELQLELSEEAKDLLVEKGWDPAMGARPLRRAIQRYIEDPLADFVLRSQVPAGSTVLVEPGVEGSEDEDVKLSVIQPAPKPTPVGVGAEGGAESEAEPGHGPEPDADKSESESE